MSVAMAEITKVKIACMGTVERNMNCKTKIELLWQSGGLNPKPVD